MSSKKTSHSTRKITGKSGPVHGVLPLNLVFDYPVSWGRYKVLRDLIQNFYDAVGYRNWQTQFSHWCENDVLYLKAADVGFSYDWLVPIGASTKRDGSGEFAGHFGEGFKIASLCAKRDHGWNIEMTSRSWELRVEVDSIKIDRKKVSSLAYQIWKHRRSQPDTILALYPFDIDDREVLKAALLSFYYPGNPLFGNEIWSDRSSAVFHRSEDPKPRGFPGSYNSPGPGIIYAGYQALGSFSFPLVIAEHGFRNPDRERNSFYQMDVIKVFKSVAREVSPACAFELLEVLRSKWYAYPRKRYDFDCWYPIVNELARRVGESNEETQKWFGKYPLLLVAKKVDRRNVVASNRRRQALSWMRGSGVSYRLVQDGFAYLGYPSLEDSCEQHGGFSQEREPTSAEEELIDVLEELVKEILPGFFGTQSDPPCKVIESDDACWGGMATCVRLSQPRKTISGRKVRYDLPHISLKRTLFREGGFHEALSTYLHERAHCFGGDQSQGFSAALTEILEITLKESKTVQRAEKEWSKRQRDLEE